MTKYLKGFITIRLWCTLCLVLISMMLHSVTLKVKMVNINMVGLHVHQINNYSECLGCEQVYLVLVRLNLLTCLPTTELSVFREFRQHPTPWCWRTDPLGYANFHPNLIFSLTVTMYNKLLLQKKITFRLKTTFSFYTFHWTLSLQSGFIDLPF